MKRSIHVKWGNLRVGILLMLALAALVWASFSGSGTSIFEKKALFTCYFRNVNGLLKGSPVWMSGVEVGNVAEVKFVNIDSIKQVQVTCRVKESVWPMMTEDAQVQLGTIGFLGDRYVEIVPGSKDKPVIKQMDIVPTRNVGEATAMFKKGEEAADEFRRLGANLDTLLARMNQGEGTLGRMARDTLLYVNMTKLTANFGTLAAQISKNQERLFTSMENAANAMKDMSAQLAKRDGSLGKVIDDPALYNNLNGTMARLDSIMAKINTGTGSAGLLVNDTLLYTQTANLMERLNNLLTDMQANPRKYFKFSVF